MYIFELLTWFLALFTVPENKLPNILDVAKAEGASTFVNYALKSDWIHDQLQNGSEYTALIPTNEAFEALPKIVKDSFQHSYVLEWYLRYHLGLTRFRTADLSNDDFLLPSAFKPPQESNLPVQEIRFNRYNIYNCEVGRTGLEEGDGVDTCFHRVRSNICHLDLPSKRVYESSGINMLPISNTLNLLTSFAITCLTF